MKRRGFTLIELLVVIAIIAILAAILFPVFAQAREKARQTQCLSGCKQIATAVYMYAQDYDECLVPGRIRAPFGTATSTAFDSLLIPYLKNDGVWTCASSPGTATTPRSITMNKHVAVDYFNNTTLAPISMAMMEYPAELVVMAEGQNAARNNFSLAFTISLAMASEICTAAKNDAAGTPQNSRFPSAQPFGRHSGGANYCYGDGHAKFSRAANTLIPNVTLFVARPAMAALPANCAGTFPNGLSNDATGR
jgi:prepilin-type N-terminal cleavage/methylation domain-containing protein/prepilin-type processing-associated H-X9-DG protein